VVAELEGFEAPAGAWESDILPARLARFQPAWLDEECRAGRVTWARLRPMNGRGRDSERSATPVRTTPITLIERRHAALWATLSSTEEAPQPSVRAQAVIECIRAEGASFFDELVDATGLLGPEVEAALGELVALGLVSSDSFAGLRALLLPAHKRKSFPGGRRQGRGGSLGMAMAGRWALARRPRPTPPGTPSPVAGGADPVAYLAHTLLRRYGVVFWRLLEREAAWLPPWRDLLRVYRRLEARGEIRGGRFVAGFTGEQFALPEAVGALRETRRKPGSGAWLSLSGADPLNLVGILTPGPRLPALAGNRVLYRDGLPIAFLAAGKVELVERLEPAEEWEAHKTLRRGAVGARPAVRPATASPRQNHATAEVA
jgi:ATP-dependent Lhr-like helicase